MTIWTAHITAHNSDLILTGFETEGEAFEVAGLLVDALRARRPQDDIELDEIEHYWPWRHISKDLR